MREHSVYCQHHWRKSQLLLVMYCINIPHSPVALCLRNKWAQLNWADIPVCWLAWWGNTSRDAGWRHYEWLSVWRKANTVWCLLMDIQTRCRYLQVDQSVFCFFLFVLFVFLQCPLCIIINPNTRWEQWHKDLTVICTKSILLMSLAATEWISVWCGIWNLQEKGILRGPYHTGPQI